LNQYSITYELNGGVHSGTPNSYTVEDLALPIAVPTKLGYAFLHWVANCPNGSQIVLPSSEIPVGTVGNLVLAAVWDGQPTQYPIAYNLNGGVLPANSYAPTEYNVQNGFTINSNALTTPTKTGYTFENWMVIYSGVVPFPLTAAGFPATFAGAVTLAAVWTQAPDDYEIVYELNGGINAPGNPVKYNVLVTFPLTIHDPTMPGYTFKHWIVTFANGTQIQLPATGLPAGYTGKVVLAAIWDFTPISYTITYDPDGGVNAPSNPTRYDVTTGQITLAPPTRTGYTFKHWLVTYAGAAQEILVGSTIPAGTIGNIALVAVWESI
jgi:uncharacterized repeat protein (TIGR02543 family)